MSKDKSTIYWGDEELPTKDAKRFLKEMNEVNPGMHKVEYSPVKLVSEETLKLLRELK